MRNSNYLLLLFFICFQPILHGQELIELQQINTYAANKNEPILHDILLPKNIPNRQKVLLIEFSIEPFAITNLNGNAIGKFEIPPSDQPTNLIIRSTILQYPIDFENASAKKDLAESSKKNLEKYLKPEKHIQSNNRKIKAKANEFNGNSQEVIVRKIFDFVVDRMTPSMRFSYSAEQDALKSLRVGKGDATAYAELMVALCRAKGIPARMVLGLVDADKRASPWHNWVEVYFKKYGWVSFDPRFADCNNKKCNTTFDNLIKDYTFYSNERFPIWHKSSDYAPRPYINNKSSFSARNILDENFQKALTHLNNFEYDDALVLLDSFITMGFNPLNYHRLKTQILCYQGNLQAAQQSLYFLEKKSKTKNEKHQLLYLKAIWYTYKEDYNNTYAMLEQWSEDIKYKYQVIGILKNEKAFKPLAQEEKFKNLLKTEDISFYKSFSTFGKLKTKDPANFGLTSIPNVINPSEYLSSQPFESYYANKLAKVQNIKFIKVTNANNTLSQLYEFDKKGNPVYYFNIGKGWEAKYDETDRKISHTDFVVLDKKITPTTKYFYDYEENLVSIRSCNGDCKKDNAKPFYQISLVEAGKKWKVEEFNEAGEIDSWATYSLDDKNRLIKIEGVQYNLPVSIEYRYDDSDYTMESRLILQGNYIVMEKYQLTPNGNILSQNQPTPFHKKLTIKRFEYDELGRLDYNHLLVDDVNNRVSNTMTYTYDQDIYLKTKSLTFINGNSIKSSSKKPGTMKFNYSYEFWE